MIRTALLATALLLGLSACYGGGSSYGPGLESSRHSPFLNLGGGGPSSSTNRGGGGADTLP